VTSEPEIVIVGAGAAGIGAGLALTRLGVPFVILEAKPRVGGRAHSDADGLGHLWDLGCHWFHCAERNPLRVLADRVGHAYLSIPETWASQYYDEGRALAPSEQAAAGEALQAAMAAADIAGAEGRDVSQWTAAAPQPPFAPFARFVFEAIGAGPADDISAVDAHRYDGGEVDYAVSGGYGRLIERLSAGLPIRLGTPVLAINSTGQGLSIDTPAGTLRAKSVILTVSNGVLAGERIAIEPDLIAPLVPLLSRMPLGMCEKIGVRLADGVLADLEHNKLLALHGGEVFSLLIRPAGRPIVTAYLAEGGAAHISKLGNAGAGALLTEVLCSLFGTSTRPGVTQAQVSAWTTDPHVLGAYSYCRAGQAAARERLLELDLAPLYLAGEACSLDWYSTAHGAYVSGILAAHRAAAQLKRGLPEPDLLWLRQAG
jgi:monoamine oxidase